MGEAMLPTEPTNITANIFKLKSQAKLPSPAVLQMLSPSDAKVLRRLLTDGAEYVPSEFLERPEAEGLLRRPLYEWEDAPPAADDSGIYRLEQSADAVQHMDREPYMFLRLNYCRRQVVGIIQQHAGRRVSAEVATELLRWERAVAATRGEIVRANLPLVLAMAKRTRISGIDLTDLISEGNLALLRAVNKFDCGRGYKFSTYACRAILKSFSRVATRTARHRGHFPTEFDPTLEKSDFVERRRVNAEDDCAHELKSILSDNVAHLSDVEQKVILARFALDRPAEDAAAKAQTLEQVGELIGVTKERVRQIQNKALIKLRAALEQAVLTR
jgi:RNA polymerase primary sigma factor